MKNLTHITIGIPAYNEENNIARLLRDIENQICNSFVIDKIILASDGSTDKTVAVASGFKHLHMQIFNNHNRLGVGARQNQISENTTSEILVVLNADIHLADTELLAKLIKPIQESNVDLVSATIQEAKPTTFFEKIIYTSMILKRQVFLNYKNGNNIYTCYGVGRAFSKALYTTLRYTDSIGEDAYSYLFCVSGKFKYECAQDANIIYKLPDNLRDHQKQSVRYMKSKEKYKKIFGKAFVEKEYKIPLISMIKSLLQVFMTHPIELSLYIVVAIYLKAKVLFAKPVKETWDISSSSKRFSF